MERLICGYWDKKPTLTRNYVKSTPRINKWFTQFLFDWISSRSLKYRIIFFGLLIAAEVVFAAEMALSPDFDLIHLHYSYQNHYSYKDAQLIALQTFTTVRCVIFIILCVVFSIKLSHIVPAASFDDYRRMIFLNVVIFTMTAIGMMFFPIVSIKMVYFGVFRTLKKPRFPGFHLHPYETTRWIDWMINYHSHFYCPKSCQKIHHRKKNSLFMYKQLVMCFINIKIAEIYRKFHRNLDTYHSDNTRMRLVPIAMVQDIVTKCNRQAIISSPFNVKYTADDATRLFTKIMCYALVLIETLQYGCVLIWYCFIFAHENKNEKTKLSASYLLLFIHHLIVGLFFIQILGKSYGKIKFMKIEKYIDNEAIEPCFCFNIDKINKFVQLIVHDDIDDWLFNSFYGGIADYIQREMLIRDLTALDQIINQCAIAEDVQLPHVVVGLVLEFLGKVDQNNLDVDAIINIYQLHIMSDTDTNNVITICE